jgi:2-methylisocitrate lyase-like PEP mutase family enzyme
MTSKPARVLRDLIANRDAPILVPGAANALSARVIEESGFSAVYVTGAGVTNTFMGMPDLGLLSLTELVAHVSAMSDAVELPLLVDADTGFGNAINVRHTVRCLERAGAAAIQIEDQVSPKRCGHFAGKRVIGADEMVMKIKAAVDARQDDDLMVIARTDARATLGIEAACERMARYHEAGADILFVEAPETLAEMRYVTGHVPGIHLANMVEGGLTPPVSRDQLAELGYAIGLYANAAMRGAVVGMRSILNHLAKQGDTIEAENLMIDWFDRQSLVRKPLFDELETQYATQDSE